jgi:hypothetical protein
MAAGAAAAAAIAQATKASGIIVKLSAPEFLKVLSKTRDPLVVVAEGGFLSKNYQYLHSYKGLAFFTKSSEPISLPREAEVVTANSIWTP